MNTMSNTTAIWSQETVGQSSGNGDWDFSGYDGTVSRFSTSSAREEPCSRAPSPPRERIPSTSAVALPPRSPSSPRARHNTNGTPRPRYHHQPTAEQLEPPMTMGHPGVQEYINECTSIGFVHNLIELAPPPEDERLYALLALRTLRYPNNPSHWVFWAMGNRSRTTEVVERELKSGRIKTSDSLDWNLFKEPSKRQAAFINESAPNKVPDSWLADSATSTGRALRSKRKHGEGEEDAEEAASAPPKKKVRTGPRLTRVKQHGKGKKAAAATEAAGDTTLVASSSNEIVDVVGEAAPAEAPKAKSKRAAKATREAPKATRSSARVRARKGDAVEENRGTMASEMTAATSNDTVATCDTEETVVEVASEEKPDPEKADKVDTDEVRDADDVADMLLVDASSVKASEVAPEEVEAKRKTRAKGKSRAKAKAQPAPALEDKAESMPAGPTTRSRKRLASTVTQAQGVKIEEEEIAVPRAVARAHNAPSPEPGPYPRSKAEQTSARKRTKSRRALEAEESAMAAPAPRRSARNRTATNGSSR